MPEFWQYLVTCEHADNQVPPDYHSLFAGAEKLLQSHRGYDPGALLLTRSLADSVAVKPIYAEITRLLIDINRSQQNPQRFSEFSLKLPKTELKRLHSELHVPYWRRVENCIRAANEQGRPMLHLSVHTFTPVLDGETRDADIGILFDPSRPAESVLAQTWLDLIRKADPSLRCRLNYPYLGTDDGLTTGMRKHFADDEYAGLELELNQAIAAEEGTLRRRVHAILRTSFTQACQHALP